MIMKRFYLLIWAIAGCCGVWGQSGPEVLRAVSEKMATMESYRIEFALEMEAAENPSKGHCVVAGERYVIAIDDLVQGCDGEVLWMVNGAVGEVTLDSPKPQSRSLFDNPTRAFDFAEEMFEDDSDNEVLAEAIDLADMVNTQRSVDLLVEKLTDLLE